MKTAVIDCEAGTFCATVWQAGRRVEILWGSYSDVIALALLAGVARADITLTGAAQAAALDTCFGGAP